MTARSALILVLCILLLISTEVLAKGYEIGVYYFPGWTDTPGAPWNPPWDKIKPFPERVPVIGFYPEKELWVAEQHIAWASQYGITFFIYDWYWNGQKTRHDHAIQNHLHAKNCDLVKLCLLWANHSEVPRTLQEFDDMVQYWISNYFSSGSYYQIDGKPVIVIFSYGQLRENAKKFNSKVIELLTRANRMAGQKGYKGIYFIATTNEIPDDDLEYRLVTNNGFNAYSGWNYVAVTGTQKRADYNLTVKTYVDYYDAATRTAKRLPYVLTASPGWDSRPWHGDKAIVRENPTPEKFETMLRAAKKIMDDPRNKMPKMLLIEAWNEFGEGSYIEPTKQWGFQYLEVIQKVFAK